MSRCSGLLLLRFRHRPVKRPTVKAVTQRLRQESQKYRPICYAEGLATKCDHAITSLVTRLYVLRSPAAVRGRISPSIIFPFKRIYRRWSRSHVGKKMFEALPTRTNANAAATIASVNPIAWLRASRLHGRPCIIFWRSTAANRMSMSDVGAAMQATAAPRVATTSKGILSYCSSGSTDTLTPPHGTAYCTQTFIKQDGQSSEVTAGQIATSHRRIIVSDSPRSKMF